MREDSHYTLGNKLILIIPEESSCDYIRNRKFIQWQSTVLPISTIKSTVLPISTIKSTVLPISTITSHLKVYTVTVNSSTNINNHLSPQGLYSDSQQFYQYQQSPLTSRFIQWQSTVLPISTITFHLKVYTVTVNSSTNINNHLSPQGLYSDSQQFYQYQQSPLTSRFIQWQSTVLPISTITSHLTGHQNTTYYDENPGTLDRQEHKCGVVKSVNGNTRTIQNIY